MSATSPQTSPVKWCGTTRLFCGDTGLKRALHLHQRPVDPHKGAQCSQIKILCACAHVRALSRALFRSLVRATVL